MLEFKRSDESKLIDSIIKEAGEDWLEREVRSPETGNMVKVKSLPLRLRKRYKPIQREKNKRLKEVSKGLKLRGYEVKHHETKDQITIYNRKSKNTYTHTKTEDGSFQLKDDKGKRLYPNRVDKAKHLHSAIIKHEFKKDPSNKKLLNMQKKKIQDIRNKR